MGWRIRLETTNLGQRRAECELELSQWRPRGRRQKHSDVVPLSG